MPGHATLKLALRLHPHVLAALSAQGETVAMRQLHRKRRWTLLFRRLQAWVTRIRT